MHLSLFFFANDLFFAASFIFIVDDGNDGVRQKANSSGFSYLGSKWVIKQWRQLTTSVVHLAQELLTSARTSAIVVQEVWQRRREP